LGKTHFYVDVTLSAIFVPPEISSTQRNDCRYGAEDDKSLTWKSKIIKEGLGRPSPLSAAVIAAHVRYILAEVPANGDCLGAPGGGADVAVARTILRAWPHCGQRARTHRNAGTIGRNHFVRDIGGITQW
jgi:hypothetical protein